MNGNPTHSTASDTSDGQDESIDYELHTDGGGSRRRFLGAAAALAALPVVSGTGAAASRLDISSDDYGSTRTSVQPGKPVFGAVEIGEIVDEESDISVSGYAYDDEEPSQVECTVNVGGAHVVLSFSPARAHEFAEELTLAATAAEQGGDA